MENSNSPKLWKWFVGILALCNVALIATIWLKPAPPAPLPHIGRRIDMNSRLNLTEEQKKQFEDLRKQNQAKIDSLKKEAAIAREVFFARVRSDVPASGEVDSLANAVAGYHKAIELQTFGHFSRLRGLLTPQQKTVFDSIVIDVLKQLPEQPRQRGEHMGPPPPPPPPGMEGAGPPPPPMDRPDEH